MDATETTEEVKDRVLLERDKAIENEFYEHMCFDADDYLPMPLKSAIIKSREMSKEYVIQEKIISCHFDSGAIVYEEDEKILNEEPILVGITGWNETCENIGFWQKIKNKIKMFFGK